MTKIRMLLALLLLLASLAVAQADSPGRAILCGDLPDADCQILLDNESVMDSLNSFAFTMSMDLSVGSHDPMQLAMQGSGALALDDEALLAINAASADISDSAMSALVELLLTSLEGEVWLQFQGSAAEEDIEMELSLRMKEGIVLVSAEALEELTGESMNGVEALGIDFNDAIGEMLEETGVMPATETGDTQMAGAAAMTITRLPDDEIDGVAVAVFETEIDLSSVLSLVSAEALLAASDDKDVSEMEQEIANEMANEMIEAMDVREFAARQYIGLDNSYTYRMDIALDMTMASATTDRRTEATIVMDMSIDMSDFNEPVEVEIPEEAFVFPLAMMMNMGSQ